MDEIRITEAITSLFEFATNREEVINLRYMINDIVEQEMENRLYDLGC
jgi:hypothetical protein